MADATTALRLSGEVPVECATKLTREAFERRFIEGGRPVVIKGLVADWPALQRWKPSPLKTNFGSKTVSIEYYPDGNYFSLWEGHKRMALSRYLEILDQAPNSSSSEKFYLAEVDIRQAFPELLNDISQPELISNPISRLPLFIGRDSVSAMHYHVSEQAILCQVYGRKRVILYAPADFKYVYAKPWYSFYLNFSNVDFDHLEAYPRIHSAKPFGCVLEPGDALFIPIHWWHLASGVDFSVSATYFWRAEWRHWIFPYPGVRAVVGWGVRNLDSKVRWAVQSSVLWSRNALR